MGVAGGWGAALIEMRGAGSGPGVVLATVLIYIAIHLLRLFVGSSCYVCSYCTEVENDAIDGTCPENCGAMANATLASTLMITSPTAATAATSDSASTTAAANIAGASSGDDDSGLSGGSVAAIVIVVLLLLVAAAVGGKYYYDRQKKVPPAGANPYEANARAMVNETYANPSFKINSSDSEEPRARLESLA